MQWENSPSYEIIVQPNRHVQSDAAPQPGIRAEIYVGYFGEIAAWLARRALACYEY